jgi:hypothetical protein
MWWFWPNNSVKERSDDTSVRIPNFSISWKQSVLLSLGKSRDWLAQLWTYRQRNNVYIHPDKISYPAEGDSKFFRNNNTSPQTSETKLGEPFLTCVNLVVDFNRIIQSEGNERYTLILANNLIVSVWLLYNHYHINCILYSKVFYTRSWQKRFDPARSSFTLSPIVVFYGKASCS